MTDPSRYAPIRGTKQASRQQEELVRRRASGLPATTQLPSVPIEKQLNPVTPSKKELRLKECFLKLNQWPK
jgi:hypothetical protein